MPLTQGRACRAAVSAYPFASSLALRPAPPANPFPGLGIRDTLHSSRTLRRDSALPPAGCILEWCDLLHCDTLEDDSARQLRGGFFERWADPPSPETHLRLLAGGDEVILALDGLAMRELISAITDGVLSAYVPSWRYRRRGHRKRLVRRMLARLDALYAVDLLCDPQLRPFYASLGMRTGYRDGGVPVYEPARQETTRRDILRP